MGVEKLKNLIFINGTAGVGKTTTSRELQKLLPNCVFLDGDWCWDMKPFVVTEETKAIVEDNVKYILNNFLKCSQYENIIFCWVMHQQNIIDIIMSGLNLRGAQLYKFSLICSEHSLIERLTKDVECGIRSDDIIARSVPRLKNYEDMDTVKIDVTSINAEQAARKMVTLIGE